MLYRICNAWSGGHPCFSLPPSGYSPHQRVQNQIQTDPVQYKHIQPYLLSYCNLPVEYFTGRRLPTAATLQTASKLNWTQSSWCKCLSALFFILCIAPFLSVHRYYRLLPFAPLLPLQAPGPSHSGAILLNLSWHLSERRKRKPQEWGN